MTTFDLTPLFRSSIGFDRFSQMFEDAMQTDQAGPSFPPYNIQMMGEDAYRITIAVAGFGEEELHAETKENALIVTGKKRPDTQNGGAFLHRGITGSNFERTFRLADHVRVVAANLDHGLLHIDLVRELPEAMKPRKVEIKSGAFENLAAKAQKVVSGKK